MVSLNLDGGSVIKFHIARSSDTVVASEVLQASRGVDEMSPIPFQLLLGKLNIFVGLAAGVSEVHISPMSIPH